MVYSKYDLDFVPLCYLQNSGQSVHENGQEKRGESAADPNPNPFLLRQYNVHQSEWTIVWVSPARNERGRECSEAVALSSSRVMEN